LKTQTTHQAKGGKAVVVADSVQNIASREESSHDHEAGQDGDEDDGGDGRRISALFEVGDHGRGGRFDAAGGPGIVDKGVMAHDLRGGHCETFL